MVTKGLKGILQSINDAVKAVGAIPREQHSPPLWTMRSRPAGGHHKSRKIYQSLFGCTDHI